MKMHSFQVRRQNGEVFYPNTAEEALQVFAVDPQAWEISFSVGNARYRIVRGERFFAWSDHFNNFIRA